MLVCVLDDGWCICAENVGCEASLWHSEINGTDFSGFVKYRGAFCPAERLANVRGRVCCLYFVLIAFTNNTFCAGGGWERVREWVGVVGEGTIWLQYSFENYRLSGASR